MTLQIINSLETMIEQVELSAVSEAALNVMAEKGAFIIAFASAESIAIVAQILIVHIVVPKIARKINE